MGSISEDTREHFRRQAILAESKITEKINKALEDPENAGRRWFWELLQNAKDCTSFNPDIAEGNYKNVRNKQVNVILSYFQTEDGLCISFEHDGNPFTNSDDPYRFDDVTNLILPVSGKDNEYQTGKFGTGFLSTHILSLKIRVEGVFINKQQQPHDFDFLIDRTKFSADNSNTEYRKEFIESIIDSQINSVNYREHTGAIKTKFTYYLNDNLKNNVEWVKNIVDEGLNDLEVLLPIVLCFNGSINSVTIKNDIANVETKFKVKPEKIAISSSDLVFTQSVHKNEQVVQILLAEVNDVTLASLFDSVDGITENRLLNISDIYKDVTKKKMPFLFSSFPLIGSDDFSFPMIINSKKFKPKETRDSISLKDNETGNQTILEEAASLYKILLKEVANERWKRVYNIANTNISIVADHKWIADDWHKKINTLLRSSILSEQIIDIPIKSPDSKESIRKSIRSQDHSILFPIDTNKEQLWKFSTVLFPELVPALDELSEWNKILWDSDKDFKKVNTEYLVRKISEFHADIKPLAEKIFGTSEGSLSKIILWLYDFAKFIQQDLKRTNLFDFKVEDKSFPILPTRDNKLRLQSELSYDRGYYANEVIEDKTLELSAEFCNIFLRNNLLRAEFDDLKLLPEDRVIIEKDIAAKISDAIKKKIYQDNLSISDKSLLSSFRNYVYSINTEKNNELDSTQSHRREKYSKLYIDVDLDRIFLSVVEKEKISSVTKLLESDRLGDINIQEIADHPELGKIFELGKKALEDERRVHADLQFKKTIGVYIENLVRNKIADMTDHFKVQVIEEQNGQDIVIWVGSEIKYYIEVKSRWKNRCFCSNE